MPDQAPKKNTVKSIARVIIKCVQITLNLLRSHQAEKPSKFQEENIYRKNKRPLSKIMPIIPCSL